MTDAVSRGYFADKPQYFKAKITPKVLPVLNPILTLKKRVPLTPHAPPSLNAFQTFTLAQASTPMSLPSYLKHDWSVRLHGKTGSGKTAIVQALCRQTRDELTATHADTLGLMIMDTMLPVKFKGNSEIDWILLRMEDSSQKITDQFSYLQVLQTNTNALASNKPKVLPFYDVHIVVFSMTDRDSMIYAKKLVSQIQLQIQLQAHYTGCIVVAATRADQVQGYQVTNLDLEQFVQEFKVSVCLINAHCNSLCEEQSAYAIVEEICDIMTVQTEVVEL